MISPSKNLASVANGSKSSMTLSSISRSFQKFFLLVSSGHYLLTNGTGRLIVTQSATGMNVTNVAKHNG